ncbi:MAG: hypothetical protein M1837_002430 [Sclerophora amabilis]|nr:MAG: hypothetical protein M1837_002430 [Sclerophora amabilis]
MGVDRRKAAVFGGAVVVRLLLFTAFPSLSDLLTGRVEISTPVTSFKRLQEGLFLYTHNLLCANALVKIADTGESGSTRLFTSPRSHVKWNSVAVGAAYLFNPFTIATCIARSTSVFTNCATLYAVERATRGKPLTSMLALSCATYLALYPMLLLPPLTILCYDRQTVSKSSKSPKSPLSFSGSMGGIFASATSILLSLSYLITGSSWEFLSSTYGVQLLLPDLTPNVGLWWYFFIEMFDPFREFFLGVFWLHLGGYVGGLCLRLRRQPLFVATCLLGIFAIFKPYPSISDTSLFLSLVPLYRHVFPLMRYTFFTASALLYATLLGPAFYYLWIYAGSGNANFFYAITLVWSLGLSVLLADLLFAVLRDEWEVERPEMKGRDVRQI